MSVSGISSTSFSQQAQELTGIAKDLQNLQKSLSSNDLSGAQTAFAQFVKDLTNNQSNKLSTGTAASSASSNKQVSAFQKDLQGLQQALQSGDLSGAQDAFAQLQSDLKSSLGQSRQAQNQGSSSSFSFSQSITEINVNIIATGGSNVNVVA